MKPLPGSDCYAVQAYLNDHAQQTITAHRHAGPRQKPKEFPIIFELAEGNHAQQLGMLERKGWTIPGIYSRSAGALRRSSAFATAVLTAKQYESLLAGKVGEIRLWSLQLPLIPGRPPNPELPFVLAAPEAAQSKVEPDLAKGGSMFGLIDSGCPFARLDMLGGPHGGRIVRLWDQDPYPALGRAGASTPALLGYGNELDRTRLRKWIDRHRDGRYAVDEEACYRNAGFDLAASDFQHGAAVLAQLAGPVSVRDNQAADPDALPSWQSSQGPANEADIVFVQLPRASVQDSTSASLPRSLLDGLRYIVGCAGPKVRRIIVNASDGTSRSAHDGQSLIERAMLALVEDLKTRRRPIELQIAIAAGNSFAELRHAQFRFGAGQAQTGQVTVKLPPGSESPNVLTIAIPPGVKGLRIAVSPPSGESNAPPLAVSGTVQFFPSKKEPVAWIVYPEPLDDQQHGLATITWSPTESFDPDTKVAPAGDWGVELSLDPKLAPQPPFDVHLWISRNQLNPGALQRAEQAHFVDVDDMYDPGRPLRPLEDDPHPARSPIRRHGTLNGLATIKPGKGIYVIGSTMLREGRPSLYSSAGPVPGRSEPSAGPDAFYPTDFSRNMQGIRVAGSFSARITRGSGTSFAAPQAARDLMNGVPSPESSRAGRRRR